MKKLWILIALPAVLLACGNGEENGNDTDLPVEWPAELKGLVELDMHEHGLPIKMMIPDTTVGKPEVIVQPYGEVEVNVGDYFRVKIGEVPEGGGIEARRRDLAEDLLFTSTYIEEGDNFVLYKSDLPDNSGTYYHFYVVTDINGVMYEVQDNDDGEYPEKSIKRMMESAKFFMLDKKEEAAAEEPA